ncbi:DUF2786 domain-containing protein [Enterococcus sp. LJL51]|uniref:DUF2786 domain-containing protein n=1 Tax=Enterococcus sp. LJL51 TaxID=3416656 RepID=UPI003CE7DFF0
MKKNNKKIIKKVKGLLAIAKDEKNDEESQSAFILAQKLMIQYEIDKSEVEDYELSNESSEINEESVTIYKRLYWWERSLARIIAKNFRVKHYLNSKYIGKQRKRRIIFYGFGRDLELAKEMYILAYDVVLYHSKIFIDEYYRTQLESRSRYMTESIKSSYIRGFLNGLSDRFDEQVAILRESFEVLVLIPEEVEKSFVVMSSEWGKPLDLVLPPVEVVQAYQQGFNDGKKIDFTKSTISI